MSDFAQKRCNEYEAERVESGTRMALALAADETLALRSRSS